MEEIHIFVERTVTQEVRKEFLSSIREYIFGFFLKSKKESMFYDDRVKEIIAEKLYLTGSATDILLKEGSAKGRAEGRVEGQMTEKLINNVIVSLNLLKALPNSSDLKIASIANTKEKFVKELRKIILKNTATKSKKLIFTHFFKDILLEEKQQKEILKSIADFYKKEKK